MVRKFKKKPVVIEAIQWDETVETLNKLQAWSRRKVGVSFSLHSIGGLRVVTLEGPLRARKGDWIIRGVNGEFYPCKPDVFEQTYEEVPDEPTGA